MFTTANQPSQQSNKEIRLKEIKRAKFFHKNSSNAKFADNPVNRMFNTDLLLQGKKEQLFRGNVKIK
jgi:hypothetical protein